MKIILASDHAGFELKQAIKNYLKETVIPAQAGILPDIIDIGCDSAERCDYPDFGYKAAEEFITQNADFGILICGSGIGISIAANRNPQIRCALCRSEEDAKLARQHNDANMIALGERITDADTAQKIISVFLSTEFEGGRHQQRVAKLGQTV